MIDAVLRPPLPQAREELRMSAVADESVDKDSIVTLWDLVASEGSWVTCTIEGCGRICGAKFDIRHATLW